MLTFERLQLHGESNQSGGSTSRNEVGSTSSASLLALRPCWFWYSLPVLSASKIFTISWTTGIREVRRATNIISWRFLPEVSAFDSDHSSVKVLADHGEGTGGCAKSSAEGSANSRWKQRSDLRKSKSKMFKAQASWSGLKWSKFPIASLSLSSH